MSAAEDEEERKHYESVQIAFQEYDKVMLREAWRVDRAHKFLTDEERCRLPPNWSQEKRKRLMQAIRLNRDFLNTVVNYGSLPPARPSAAGDQQCAHENESSESVRIPVPPRGPTIVSPARHISKLKSILHHVVRDWGSEGKQERKMCYDPIVEKLQQCMPVHSEERYKRKVLVPGAGLGRLTLEIASRGYATQGNEFSYFMLFTSNFILNSTLEANSLSICPYIDNPSNIVQTEDYSRVVTLPDVSPAEMLDLNIGEEPVEQSFPEFSMAAGEFLDVYKDECSSWDSVVTCFFLDTAPNVLRYIEAIHRLLKPGGYWINLGPLLYHWQTAELGETDQRYAESLELSWEDIKHIISTYEDLELLDEEWRECDYTRNVKSMMSIKYNCIFFTIRKRPAS